MHTYDLMKMTCSRFIGGACTKVPLQRGTEGLLVAEFPDGLHTTEFPCLMLAARPAQAIKRPAAADKRPAAAEAAPAAAAEAPPPAPAAAPAAAEGAAPEPEKNDYGVMIYKKKGVVTCGALREKFGGKQQVLAFGAGTCVSEEKLREIAKILIKDLQSGNHKDVVKAKGNRLASEAAEG